MLSCSESSLFSDPLIPPVLVVFEYMMKMDKTCKDLWFAFPSSLFISRIDLVVIIVYFFSPLRIGFMVLDKLNLKSSSPSLNHLLLHDFTIKNLTSFFTVFRLQFIEGFFRMSLSIKIYLNNVSNESICREYFRSEHRNHRTFSC